jgi:myotubularin-related protein 1/2
VDLYDAREKISVFANQMIGKGGERAENYSNCNVSYNNIPGMHVIQKQFKKICEFIGTLPKNEDESFHKVLGDSNWMKSLSLTLKMSLKMAESMRKGRSVFVHCSDGWDRTAQASALCQIFLDSYYRTFEGFMVLIEKEFSQTGHMLRKRLGVFSKDTQNRSPIFLQFLDVVHNILYQYPLCFQFNQLFLRDLALVAYFGVLVNFVYDEERLRAQNKIRNMGLHAFDFFNMYKEKYMTHSFDMKKTIGKVSCQEHNLRFWKEYFFMYFEPKQNLFEVPQ